MSIKPKDVWLGFTGPVKHKNIDTISITLFVSLTEHPNDYNYINGASGEIPTELVNWIINQCQSKFHQLAQPTPKSPS